MGFSLDDIASCFCKDDCKDGKDKKGKGNIILLIIIVLIFCGCGGAGKFQECVCSPCKPQRCGNTSNGLGGTWIIIVVILLCLCGNNGLGDIFGDSGNTNTNIINLEREDDFEDDFC